MGISQTPMDYSLTLPAGTSQEVLNINPRRSSAVFTNDSDTEIYLSLIGPAVANAGIRINALGGLYEINYTNPWYGKVYAYCSAAKRLCVHEVSTYAR